MFCSVTESVNKEVEVETVGEGAQLAQPAHLGETPPSKLSHFLNLTVNCSRSDICSMLAARKIPFTTSASFVSTLPVYM